MLSNFIKTLPSDLLRVCINKLWKISHIASLDILESPSRNIFNAAINCMYTSSRVSPMLNFSYSATGIIISGVFIILGFQLEELLLGLNHQEIYQIYEGKSYRR